jgi:rhamnulokinase
MPLNAYAAIDLGAESGRIMLGVLDAESIDLQEVHRFENRPYTGPSGLHWDVESLWRAVLVGLRLADAAAEKRGARLASIGVDTWGVDYGLIDERGELLEAPHAYRDPRNQPAYERCLARLGAKAIYDATGIQLMPLNTLFQLAAAAEADRGLLDRAQRLVFMPDLMHYRLTGVAACEATIASTSQMIDTRTGRWASSVLRGLGLPSHFLSPTTPAGTRIGVVRDEVLREIGSAGPIDVVLPASHDTASAVVAVPALANASWCYLSSGTWSLLGAELDAPHISDASRAAPFTNEGGLGGSIRFLKNITGLWLLQECRREWAAGGREYSYAELAKAAAASPPLRTLIDPQSPEFGAPGDMSRKIADFARRTGQPIPEAVGEIVRCCFDSLVLCYRQTLERLEAVLNRRFDVLHIVGGGSRNELLTQMTADATGRLVIGGPHEATALGNILVQALGRGEIADRGDLRDIVRRSTRPKSYEPRDCGGIWDAAFERIRALAD